MTPARRSVQRYLREATRGLPPGQRRLVRAELEGHLQQRVLELGAGGLPAAQATERALEELGRPRLVRAGMLRLYLPPRLLPWLALLALTLSLWLAWPRPQAIALQPWDLGAPGLVQPALVGLDDLERALGRQGVEVRPVRMLGFVQTVSIRLPEGEILVRTVRQGERLFVALDELVMNALEFGLPLRLAGWERLRLRIGGVELALGGAADAYSTYAGLARRAVLGDDYAPLFFGRRGACRHQIQTADRPGAVYALVVPARPVSSGPVAESRIADVAPVGPGGRLLLSSPQPELRLGGGPDAKGAMLVRLEGGAAGGRVAHEIVRPESVRDLGCG